MKTTVPAMTMTRVEEIQRVQQQAARELAAAFDAATAALAELFPQRREGA